MGAFHFTPSEIAGLGISGTLTGAWLGARINGRTQRDVSAAAVTTQRSVSETALTAQRKLAEDQRLWTERKHVYLEIMDDLERRSEFRDDIDDPECDGEYAPTPEQWRNLNVRTNAFGSTEVLELLKASRKAHLIWLQSTRDRQEATAHHDGSATSTERISQLNSRVAEVSASAHSVDTALINRIRSEVQGE
ncbi:hypothetical protein [Streptomyces sp. NBC_00986]|uniref:hypothetical protein n=1 Tax=Streptomyces sp. NBC_00986 TaxID=2903702 RepID=UPI00386BB534|nr:hypothetical protein OG504_25960 [Streptomyces sp. NBC_00986]